jgi:hypothetical protein
VVGLSVRAGPAQVELASAGSEHFRHGVEQRAQLRIAVLLVLDGLGIDPERDVVDEHAPVDLREVDGALATVDERIECSDDLVAVDAEVEREVVARAGGMHAYGSARSAASAATIACEPSPPAIASASAPRAMASRTSCSRSHGGPSSIGSMPRANAARDAASARSIQDDEGAIARQASTTRPRGNALTALPMANKTVAVPTISAMIAAIC